MHFVGALEGHNDIIVHDRRPSAFFFNWSSLHLLFVTSLASFKVSEILYNHIDLYYIQMHPSLFASLQFPHLLGWLSSLKSHNLFIAALFLPALLLPFLSPMKTLFPAQNSQCCCYTNPFLSNPRSHCYHLTWTLLRLVLIRAFYMA